jgi:hypothetical protein
MVEDVAQRTHINSLPALFADVEMIGLVSRSPSTRCDLRAFSFSRSMGRISALTALQIERRRFVFQRGVGKSGFEARYRRRACCSSVPVVNLG